MPQRSHAVAARSVGCAALLALAVALLADTPAAGTRPAAPVRPNARTTAVRANPPSTPSTLVVTVLGPEGRPLKGALVVVRSSYGAYTDAFEERPERRRSALTDVEGRVRLSPLPKAPWDVSADARGFVARSEARVSVAALTLRLERGGSISGIVRDGSSRAPLPGVRVGLDEFRSKSDWEDQATRNEAVTDASGAFRLGGLGRFAVTLVARAIGYGPGRREGVRAGARVELFLFSGATLRGSVHDEGGRPVKGAAIRLQGDSWSPPAPVEPSDARGDFVVAGVEPGEYLVVAREGSRAPAIEAVIVAPRSEASVELTLGAGGYVSGRVVDAAGKPLAGARARFVTFEERGLPPFVRDALAATSAADGTFAIGPMAVGKLGLELTLAGFVPRRLEVDLLARQAADVRDVVLEPGLSIRGRVRDRERNGISGALVRAQQVGSGGPAPDAASSEAESDSDGAFVIAGLKPGAHQVTASAPGFARASRSVDAGANPVDLLLELGGSIVGRVVDAKGEPVDGATIFGESATQTLGSGSARWLSGSSGGAEGEGRFVLRDAAADSYSLRVRATGQGEASLADVKVVAGRATDVGTITLGRGGRVAGSVVDADGEGVPGATVSIERDTNVHTGDLTAQTDSAGAFEVRGVPPGRVAVTARHPAFVAARGEAEVDLEKEPSALRLVLSRGGRLEGRVRHRDGSPFAGARMQASPAYGGSGAGAGGPDLAPTAADGSFVVEHVPAGTVRVSALTFVPSHPAVGGGAGVTILAGIGSREVEVREGETTTVEIATREVVIAGRVTRGGQGMSGVRVSAMTADSGSVISMVGPNAPRASAPPAGPPPLAATTREDGAYELLVFGPGHAWVRLASETSSQAYPPRETEIPDVERYEFDIELAEATVSGLVVDRDTGAPVADSTVALREPSPGGKWKGGGAVSPAGRFSIGADAGEYVLEARAPGRKVATLPLSVGASGLTDVRVELEHGLEIAGRVVDSAGRPAGGLSVVASDPDSAQRPQYAHTQTDGRFRLSGLDSKAYVVASGSELSGFAIRPGAVPGEEPIVLRLQPGGRVLLHVVGPDGQPVKQVYPQVRTWEGLSVDVPGTSSSPTETPGLYELRVPSGTIGLQVGWDKPYGTATVAVRAGETTAAEMKLQELPPH